MSRSLNTHAQVNGAFLYKLNPNDKETAISASIVIGGLSGEFIHARDTEKYLVNKKIFTNEVLQEALKVLDREIVAKVIPGDLEPEYRKKCALGIFYKVIILFWSFRGSSLANFVECMPATCEYFIFVQSKENQPLPAQTQTLIMSD